MLRGSLPPDAAPVRRRRRNGLAAGVSWFVSAHTATAPSRSSSMMGTLSTSRSGLASRWNQRKKPGSRSRSVLVTTVTSGIVGSCSATSRISMPPPPEAAGARGSHRLAALFHVSTLPLAGSASTTSRPWSLRTVGLG